MQVEIDVAEPVALYEPGGHIAHSVLPGEELYLPAKQAKHEVE